MADKQIQQAILETMASFVDGEIDNIDKRNINIAIQKLEELSNLFDLTMEGKYENISSYYSVEKGWDPYLYKIKSVNNYTKALHLITEILDLIRGKPLMLEVYKIEHDENGKVSSMTKFVGKESDVNLIVKTVKYNNFEKEEIHYLRESLEKQQIVDEQFIHHYEQFENIAKTRFQKHRKEKRYSNFNEGHIIEAYQRHLAWKAHKDFTDKITPKHVAIMLYYSMNSTGWWQGGDVGYSQIKGNNTRLATQKSIRLVANKLIQMFQNPNTFTPEMFKKMFSINELEEIADYEKLSKKTLNNFLIQEGQSLNKNNNINVTIEMTNN